MKDYPPTPFHFTRRHTVSQPNPELVPTSGLTSQLALTFFPRLGLQGKPPCKFQGSEFWCSHLCGKGFPASPLLGEYLTLSDAEHLVPFTSPPFVACLSPSHAHQLRHLCVSSSPSVVSKHLDLCQARSVILPARGMKVCPPLRLGSHLVLKPWP